MPTKPTTSSGKEKKGKGQTKHGYTIKGGADGIGDGVNIAVGERKEFCSSIHRSSKEGKESGSGRPDSSSRKEGERRGKKKKGKGTFSVTRSGCKATMRKRE